jgi:prolyl-tRNA editing enzyme YbaK/EbsC (Cys-tRNA(Pro) deacylase)
LGTVVDEALAGNFQIAAGPYIVAVGGKAGRAEPPPPSIGYAKVLELLKLHHVPLDIRQHSPVRTIKDLQSVLTVPTQQMAKSVLVAVDRRDAAPVSAAAELFLCCVPANRSLSLGKLAKLLQRPRRQIRLASQIEVEERTGFLVGSIPPFGMPAHIPVIVDEGITSLRYIWCGTGKATESLRLSIDDLRRLSACTEGDISKDTRPEDE